MNSLCSKLLQTSSRYSYLNISNKCKFYIPQCTFSSISPGSKEYFDDLVSKNKVVIFMKGTPDDPRCGFSNAVVQILRMHGVKYDSYDVLEDETIRQGIKEYSDWPTIPQVYFNKEFVGGCDIFLQMHQTGDLVKELKQIGIKSLVSNNSEGSTKS